MSLRCFVLAFCVTDALTLLANYSGHSPCPSSLHGLHWIETSLQACTTISAAYGSWNRSIDSAPLRQFCTEPSWWIGHLLSEVGTLYSAAQAALLASQLPLGGLAWVGLAVSNAPLAWTWGDNSTSTYALTDGAAWDTGLLPSPMAGTCAVLNSVGRLQSWPCADRSTVHHVACSIPSCRCPSGRPEDWDCMTAVYKSTRSQGTGWSSGFTCAPLRDSAPILSFTVLPNSLSVSGTREEGWGWLTDDSAELVPFQNITKAREFGCGTVLHNTSDRDTQLAAVPFHRGDTLLTFHSQPTPWFLLQGYLYAENSRAFNGLHARRMKGTGEAYYDCPLAPEGFPMAGYVPTLRHFVRPRVISSGPFHVCVILASPRGAVRCWGGPSTYREYGADDSVLAVPADLPPVSSLASNDNSVCALFDGHTDIEPGVRCWGGRANIKLPPTWSSDEDRAPFSIAAGTDAMCYATDYRTVVRCWETHTAPVPSPDSSSLGTVWSISHGGSVSCFVQGATLNVICTGSWFGHVPSDLPPVFALAGGRDHMCAHLLGSGAVRCWDEAGFSTLPKVTQLTEEEPASFLAYRNGRACVILASTGRPVCFDAIERDFPGSASLPPMVSLDLSCNGDCACGVSAINGSVHCWGTIDRTTEDIDKGDDYEGPDPRDVPADVLAVGAVLPTGHVRASFRVEAQGTDERLFVPLALDLNHPLDVVSIDWSVPPFPQSEKPFALDLMVKRGPAARGTNASSMFELVAADSALAYPEITVWTQSTAVSAPTPVSCVQHLMYSDYMIKCTSYASMMYGTSIRWWTGGGFKTMAARRPGLPSLESATRLPTAGVLGILSIDLVSVAEQLRAALPNTTQYGTTRVVAVRPGDELELTGTHFGLNAALLSTAVPWWRPDSASLLRSCLHLSWWASPAAYHDPTGSDSNSCECNGKEDWVGEGEVPLSNIVAWNNTLVRFIVPPGEGVREVRLCVEGRGMDGGTNAPRSAGSIFLVWEPPVLSETLPSSFLDYTDRDTPVAAVLQMKQSRPSSSTFPTLASSWGGCYNGSNTIPANSTAGRRMYSVPLAVEAYTAVVRHCTSSVVIEDSLGGCSATPALPGTLASTSLSSTRPECSTALAPLSVEEGQTALLPYLPTVPDRLLDPFVVIVPLPAALPNAVLSVTYSVHTHDAGLRISAAPALASTVVGRTSPVLRSVSPNPLLLGPEVSTSGGALVTLTGPGLRTQGEVLHPRNGLLAVLGNNTNTSVWVDGIPCSNVEVVRSSEAPLGYVTCTYPSSLAAGGSHIVRLDMVGITTVLDPSDGVSAGLYTACAEGYFGLFAAEGHRTCLPCPIGASCAQGIGLAPKAQAGFYNLGLPPRFNESTETDMERQSLTGVQVLGPSPCPEDAGQSRPVACVLACDPSEACLGDNRCSEGYISLPPAYRCASCAPGYYRSSSVCIRCPFIGLVSILLLLLAAVGALSVLYVLSKNDLRLGTVGIVLEYTQLLSLLQGPSLPWPPAVRAFLSSLSIIRVNTEVLAPECWAFSLSPEAKLWVVILLPFAVVLCATCLYWAMAAVKAVWPGRRRSSDALLHGPRVWRTTLWLLGALYLPLIQASLEVYNCNPTEPADGSEYMSVVFEKCWVPGGLQARMIPWAQAGLVLVGAGFPLLIAVFFYRHSADITEDQVLLAAGVRPSLRASPRAHMLRLFFSPLYVDYRPGHHWAALAKNARCALVCICALMLNKSPALLAASVAFVLQIALLMNVASMPLMTPHTGYMAALYDLSRQIRKGLRQGKQGSGRLQSRLIQLAETCRLQVLQDLAQGRLLDEDCPGGVPLPLVLQGAGSAWKAALDWNRLEIFLQAHVILTALLSIMYTAGLESVYAARGVPAVTAMFVLLQLLAAAHITLAGCWDGMYQVGTAVSTWLRSTADQDSGEVEAEEGVEGGAELILSELYEPSLSLTSRAHTASLLLYLCCFRGCLGKSRARALWALRSTLDRTVNETAYAAAATCAPPLEEWTRNPIDRGKGGTHEVQDQGLKKDSRRAQAVAMLYESARVHVGPTATADVT